MSRTIRWTMACVAIAVALMAINAGVSGQIFLGGPPPQGQWAAQPSTASGEWPH